MISKATVKNFAEKPNSAGLKGDGASSLGVRDKEKILGDQEIGDYLNKVSDPNWVDPNRKVRGAGSNELGKDAFMRLMLEQMKNQDPTDPVKHHEMAAQLAQFSSLEQLVNVNQNLEGMKQSQSPAANFQSLSFIGKTVSGDASRIIRADGDKQHEIKFGLGADAKEATIEISDFNGNIVKKIELPAPKKGENEVTWDGIAENGQATKSGEYRVKIEAKTEAGKKLAVETKFEGKVSGVNLTAEGPVLLVGNKSVRLSEVKKIVDESALDTKKEIIENKLASDIGSKDGRKPMPLVNNKESEGKKGLPL